MSKRKITTPLIAILIISNLVTLILLFVNMSSERDQQERKVVSESLNNKEVDKPPLIQKISKQTIGIEIDSIISQYDVIKRGRYREFIEDYKLAIQKEPPYTAGATDAYTYTKLGDYEKAIKLCEEEIARSSYTEHFYTMAWIYAKTGKYDKAIDVCNKTIQKHRQYSKIFHILGWVHAKLGNNDKALDACNNALKLDPYSAWVYYGLGRIYLMLGNPEKAIESYKEAIQLQSDFAEAYLFLGLTYAELGNKEKAIESYSKAILFDKYYPEPYFFLGVTYDESGQYKKAIESFEQAKTWYNVVKETEIRINSMGIKPDLTTIHCIIGACYLRLSQEFKASLAFKDSINIDDSHAEAHYGLALAYVLLDKKDEAFEEYETVKSLKGEKFAKPLFDIIQNASSIER